MADRAPPGRHGIYVASRASLAGRLAMWRGLRAAGWPICCSWIDEDGPAETADFAALWPRIVAEMATAAALVVYAEPDDLPVRGVLVEVGLALANGIPVMLVTPGLHLIGRSCQPLGSWILHPLVQRQPSIEAAFQTVTGRLKP